MTDRVVRAPGWGYTIGIVRTRADEKELLRLYWGVGKAGFRLPWLHL